MYAGKAASHHPLATEPWALPGKESVFLHPGLPNQAHGDTDLPAVLREVRHNRTAGRMEDGQPHWKQSYLRKIINCEDLLANNRAL